MNWLDNLFKKKRIFMDYASATPVLEEVRRAMEKYWSADFYNASAIYGEGVQLKKELEGYRSKVALEIGAGSSDIIWTSGGTESVNLAILGVFEEAKKTIAKPHIIISAIEHPAVMKAAQEALRRGGELDVIDVNEEGVVSLEQLKKLIKKSTVLVSVTFASGEIGTIEPISSIGRLVREERKKRGGNYPLLHTDASQAVSYIDTTLEKLQSDLITLDGAKIYGPKGVGILAIRKWVKLHPLMFGGSQEKGLRAGTANIPLIAGFTKALEITARDRVNESKRLEYLRRTFIERVMKRLPQVLVNGGSVSHLPNIVSLSVPGTLSEFLLLKLDKEGLLVSVGTACSLDEKTSGSPVIVALGKDDLKESTLRFSFGRGTTQKDIERATEIFCQAAQNLVKYEK